VKRQQDGGPCHSRARCRRRSASPSWHACSEAPRAPRGSPARGAAAPPGGEPRRGAQI
jgi:hypothetical protein